jgi:hypothetical protein
VTADAPFATGSTLVITVRNTISKSFANVSLDEVFHAGVYLPQDRPNNSLSAAMPPALRIAFQEISARQAGRGTNRYHRCVPKISADGAAS